MPRYVSRSARAARRAYEEDYWPAEPFLTRIDAWERDPVDTGLLDASGTPIFRVSDPIGFRF